MKTAKTIPSVNCDSSERLMLMKTHNPQNERIKRAYFAYLRKPRASARPRSTASRRP